MIVLGIMIVVALFHIYQTPVKPEDCEPVSRGTLRNRPLMCPRG